jgi:hypothetical protein
MATQLTEHEDLAFAHFKEALEGDPRRYPHGAAFVSTESPHARELLLRHFREGRPVVLVFPDGEERIVRPFRPHDLHALTVLGEAVRESAASLRALFSRSVHDVRDALSRNTRTPR